MIEVEDVTNGAKREGGSHSTVSENAGNKLLVEPSRKLMLAVLLPILIFFLGGWFVVNAFFNSYQNKLEKEGVVDFGYEPEKLNQMNYETNILHKYGYEDVKTGRVRIPVDKAMDKAIKYYEEKKSFTNDK